MGQQLTGLKPRRVSLVRRGANQRDILIAKADDDTAVDPDVVGMLEAPVAKEDALLDAVRDAGGDETVEKAGSVVARTLDAIRKAFGGNTPESLRKAIDDMMDADGDSDVEPDEDDVEKAYEARIAKKDYSAEQRREMAKDGRALPNGSYPIDDRGDLEDAIHAVGRGKSPHSEIRDHIVAQAKRLKATDLLPDTWNVQKEDSMTETAQAVPVKKEDGSWDFSAVPEDQRAGYELLLKAHEDEVAALRKANDDEKSKAEEAIEIAKAERDARETREFVAKSAELEHIAKDDAEFGSVLKSIAHAERDGHLPEGTVEKLDGVLKAADEAAKAGGIFKEAGKTGHGESGDAEQQLLAKAEEIRKADTSLTAEQAYAKALEQNPDLYDRIRKEQ